MRSTLFLLLSSFILHPSSFVFADGGTVRLSQREGNYQITVLTAPTPLRAGPIDVSVFVQKAGTTDLVLDGQIAITAIPRDHAGRTISQVATPEAATNKLFQAANFQLPEPGWWNVEVSIEGPLGDARTDFEVEVVEPLPKWLAMWPWFSWPAIVIVLFGFRELVVKSRRGQRSPAAL